MLKRLRKRRSLLAAVALGLAAAPALFGGVAAAPVDYPGAPPLNSDPRLTLPPDPAAVEAALVLAQGRMIADLAPEEYRPLVVRAANAFSVDPRLLAAIVTVETEWDRFAVGSHGELGLMQIMPATGEWLAELAGLKEYDLADPTTSLRLGALYMSALLREYGTPEKALAVYNGGPAAAEHWQTNLYARRVLKHYRRPPHRADRSAVAS
jgi:soluble lytic murein transglycosylase-like protein